MTRMWGVDPELMCDRHLLGEHREMHQEAGTLNNHPHGRAVVEGHAENGQVDTSLLKQRHDELVKEMEKRGFQHDSSMEYSDELDLGSIDAEENVKELAERCRECRERIESSRFEI